MKLVKKTLFVLVLGLGLSLTAFAQKDDQRKPPPKDGKPPVIEPGRKPPPKSEEKPKKPGGEYGLLPGTYLKESA